MATEVLDIIVRERGSARAARNITGVSTAATGAARALRLVAGALAAVGVAIGAKAFFDLANQAVTLNNRLRVLTSSQEEVNVLFVELLVVANETRQPLADVVQLFQRVGIAAGELGASQKDVIDLTRQVGQLLAIQGGNAAQSAGALLQLSQAFASGIVRAEEFNSILEGAFPIALAAAKGLDRAGGSVGKLRKLIAEGSVTSREFFDALRSQASETETQFANTTATLDQSFTVLSNQLLAAVRDINAVFGATEIAGESILSLSEGLREGLITAAASGVDAFGDLLSAGADVFDLLENLGLTSSRLGLTFTILGESISALLDGILVFFQALRTGFASLAFGISSIGNALGIVSDVDFIEAIEDFEQARADLFDQADKTNDNLAAGLAKINREALALAATTGPDSEISDGLRAAADQAALLAQRLRLARDASQELGGVSDVAPVVAADTEASTEQKRALKELLSIEIRIRRERLAAVSPLLAQVDQLEEQIRDLQEIQRLTGEIERTDRAIAQLRAQQAELSGRVASAFGELPALREDIEGAIEALGRLDPEAARDFTRRFNELLTEGLAPEELSERLGALLQRVNDDLEETAFSFGDSLASATTDSLRGAVRSALRGEEAFDFQDFFAERLATVTEESLNNVFAEAEASLGEIFSGLGDTLSASLGGGEGGLFGAGGLLEGRGAAIGSAIGSVAGIALSAAFADTGADISNNLARSAVTSSRATRGVVAGPTSIPIFQIGAEIESAFDATNAILTDILAAVRVGSGGGGSSVPGIGSAAADLSLATSTTA